METDMDKLRKDLDDQGFLVLNEVLDGDALSLYCGLYEVLGQRKFICAVLGCQVLLFAILVKALKDKYRDSPVSAVFWSPATRTIWKTALIEDRFSTKVTILDFWIFKVHFLGILFAYITASNQ